MTQNEISLLVISVLGWILALVANVRLMRVDAHARDAISDLNDRYHAHMIYHLDEMGREMKRSREEHERARASRFTFNENSFRTGSL